VEGTQREYAVDGLLVESGAAERPGGSLNAIKNTDNHAHGNVLFQYYACKMRFGVTEVQLINIEGLYSRFFMNN